MSKSTLSSFQKMIDLNIPIIHINDYDTARVDELIRNAASGQKIVEWNPAACYIRDFNHKMDTVSVSLEDFLMNRLDEDGDGFIVLREVNDYLDKPEVKMALSYMSQRKFYDDSYNKTVIIVSSVVKIPVEVEPYVSFLEIDYPDDDEINALIDSHINVNKYDKGKFTKEDREKLMPSLRGLSSFEIDRMLDMAMSSNGDLSAKDNILILKQKEQMVKKSGVLEFVPVTETLEDIGGLEVLKEYLKRKAQIYERLADATKSGVAVPKGIFLVGMPGCGKSLCAKATAAAFNGIPLLKMDMGSLMGKYVGESEANMNKALKIAEAAAPCVLWIDEIEKAFSGIGGESDVMTRMFGHFLSWMQEKTKPVYVFATANNADKLPPELKRKGRFDEIFCVNLPNDNERKEIFKVHLRKKDRKLEKNRGKGCVVDIYYDENDKVLDSLMKLTEGFNGADIEALVNEAVEECFLDESKPLTVEVIENVKKDRAIKGISESCRSQIDSMKKIFKDNNFTDASKSN